MFYNNKGVLVMLKNDYDFVYSYYLVVINVDYKYFGVWGNFGVFFRFNNDF